MSSAFAITLPRQLYKQGAQSAEWDLGLSGLFQNGKVNLFKFLLLPQGLLSKFELILAMYICSTDSKTVLR